MDEHNWATLNMITKPELDVLARSLRTWLDENIGVASSDDIDAAYDLIGKLRAAKRRAGWVS
jgi:hypothetical protein